MKIILNSKNQIKMEIEKVSDRPFYSMQFHGDYLFDKYLSEGSCNLDDFSTFINENLIRDGRKSVSPINFGCAVFTACNPDGDVIFARNLDCGCAIPMMIRLSESGNYKSLAMLNMAELDWDENTYDTLELDAKLTLAAPYSPADGINEHGLAVAIMTDSTAVYPSDNCITLFDESLPRLILDRAKTVEEAIQYAKKYNLFYSVYPLHYMVADAAGNSAVIEFVDGKMVTTIKRKGYQIATNFTIYNNPRHEGFGKDRYENIEKELKKSSGIISESNALNLLKQNVIHGDEQWSAVYNLTKKSVKLTFSKEYYKVYTYQL